MRPSSVILAILAILIVALIGAAIWFLVVMGDFMCGYDNSC